MLKNFDHFVYVHVNSSPWNVVRFASQIGQNVDHGEIGIDFAECVQKQIVYYVRTVFWRELLQNKKSLVNKKMIYVF